MRYRKTIAKCARVSGIGVHNGEPSAVTFHPAPYGDGLVFYGPDPIVADWKNITNTVLYTTIENTSGHSVAMVEHLLSACYGLGLTDLHIHVEGKEAPICDGSAKQYYQTLLEAGCVASKTEETLWAVIRHPVRVNQGNRWVEFSPGNPLFSVVSTPDTGVVHEYAFDPFVDSFQHDIAPARTFMRLCDVEKIKEWGYIKGGSLDVALVWDKGAPINPGGMILDNETARHKILDMMGDFSLQGAFIAGKVQALNPGHQLNYEALCALNQEPNAVSMMTWSQWQDECFQQQPVSPKQSVFGA